MTNRSTVNSIADLLDAMGIDVASMIKLRLQQAPFSPTAEWRCDPE